MGGHQLSKKIFYFDFSSIFERHCWNSMCRVVFLLSSSRAVCTKQLAEHQNLQFKSVSRKLIQSATSVCLFINLEPRFRQSIGFFVSNIVSKKLDWAKIFNRKEKVEVKVISPKKIFLKCFQSQDIMLLDQPGSFTMTTVAQKLESFESLAEIASRFADS